MRKFALFITCSLLTLSLLTSCTQSVPGSAQEAVQSRYTKKEVRIPMRDGVELFTSIYEPKDTSRPHPILMTRTCYGDDVLGEDRYKDLTAVAYRPYYDNDYIIVFQDVRGKNMSDGVFEEVRPFNPSKQGTETDEASDTYDTVEWLIHNTNSNGNVGIYGISYRGFYATLAGLSNHPAVKAVSPQAPVTDWFVGDDFHHNGALCQVDLSGFTASFQYTGTKAVRSGQVSYRDLKLPNFNYTDIYDDMLRFETTKDFGKMYGDSVIFWNDIVAHPDYDDWWKARTPLPHLKDIQPAVMVVGGLFDAEDCWGAFATYKALRDQSPKTDLYLVEGPWAHGYWVRGRSEFFGNVYFGPQITPDWYLENVEYPFFAYYLEGKGEKPRTGARVFDTGSCTLKQYDEGWPEVSVAQSTPFYLTKDGGIIQGAPSGSQAGSLTYTSDPSRPVPYEMQPGDSRTREYMDADQRFAAWRPDVLTFQTPVLEEQMSLSGEVEADLMVDITSTDADFIVKVIDVFPDDFSYDKTLYEKNKQNPYLMAGYQMLVRGEVMRGKYRESLSEPVPFVPGKSTRVRFTLPDVRHTFLPGHRLMIQVQSSWFPLVDRNPQTFCNIYEAEKKDYVKTDVTLHLGDALGASLVRLPLVR